MKRFTMTHEFNCSPDTFWKINFDREMNEAMYKRGLGFPEYTVTELRDDEREIFRRTVATPTVNAPAVVQKAMGSGFRYTEETRFNKATKVLNFKGIPSVMADKLTTEGTMRVEAIANGARCRRTIEVTIEAKIFGVGSIIEAFSEGEMRKGWDQSAAYMNRWLKDHPKAG